jgi:hypothetical protein
MASPERNRFASLPERRYRLPFAIGTDRGSTVS